MTPDLDSPLWAALHDAYGAADEVPVWLGRLEDRDLDDDPLGELYGRICHQGSVYPASIAVMPHLVRIAESASDDPGFQADVLSLAGAICESPELSPLLDTSPFAAPFLASVARAEGLARQLLPTLSEGGAEIHVVKAALAFAGQRVAARVLDGFVDEEFALACPGCGTDLYVWPVGDGLATAAEDPVSHPSTPTLPVSPDRPAGSSWDAARRHIEDLLSTAPGLSAVLARLPHLFGTASCPACGASFSLMDAWAEENA